MPELPEVEVTRQGIAPDLTGRAVTAVVVRTDRLRYPLPALPELLTGRALKTISRRGKYLLFDFGPGTLLIHLGMSGSLRLVPAGMTAGKHDHLDIEFGPIVLRLRDPRRFGAALWLDRQTSSPLEAHPLLAGLGIEPLSEQFTPEWLYRATRAKTTPIKQALMEARMVVGVGNIYASESLFHAGIHPRRPAGKISRARCERLVASIRTTLQRAIAAGGSSLRDFVRSDGSSGYFQQQYFVYGRDGEACRVCGAAVRCVRQGQRATFYCGQCQR